MSWRASLYWIAAMFMVRTMSRWFELFGESHPRATFTPAASSSGMRPFSGTPRAPLAAVTGHIATVAPVRAMHAISASSTPERVGQADVRAEHADRLQVLGGRPAVARLGVGAGLRPAAVVQGEARPVLVDHALEPCSSSAVHVSGENGMAQARIRPSRRRATSDERIRARDGVLRGVAGA